ncbi:cytochrome P450 monooxygenase CYP52X1 [Cordyceps fumosorosea ARSEF 2679]|uniref:Cytochrome P450 monooxygenase CYP52X1 n=1 Tax=Cordyceps fumosorosea (strain ARSEF 2679) TaxID=1081104 RepID=A0A167LJQ6_CORFA|nr:cytochrome P450 monooxygenase CYP52X1 [Cordyceps fumosorosea ARSEF 2679]OAA53167.1 cytochrome P450 monooxygenase CYP52X1 [Cordyceps fumosorosea ARSEF 2679]
MAVLSVISIPALLVSLAVAFVLVHAIQYIRFRTKAARLGCKPAVAGFNGDMAGLSLMRMGLKAQREKNVPNWMRQEFARLSAREGRPVGTFAMSAPLFRRALFTAEPENIKTILATSFKDFSLGKNRTGNFKPLLGDGIFASDGKKWEHSRAMLRPQFVRSQVSDISLEETHVQNLMAVLEGQLDSTTGWSSAVDLSPLFFRLTLDSATEFLFGESVNSQLRREGDATTSAAAFATSFDASQNQLAVAGRYGSNYWIGHTKEFHKDVRICHEFIDYFVQKAMNGQRSVGEKEGERYVFLEAIAKETSDPVELRSQLINILLAGRDTTASTLGWFFYTLGQARHRHLYKRLRDAVLDEFGTYRDPKPITFEGLKNLTYLQWCVNETLRLYPIVPMNGRSAVKDTVLPVGGGPDGRSPILVRKGQDVGYSVHVMHHRTDLWGADADDFRPERWEKRKPGWDYLPFNGGPRICIGQQFALTEIAYIVVRMLQRFDELDGSALPLESHGLGLTNCPGEGVPLRLHFAE